MSEPEIYKDEPIPARAEGQDTAQPALFQEDMPEGIPADPVRPQPGSSTHLQSGLRRYYPHAAAFPEGNKSYGDGNSVKSHSVKNRRERDGSSIFIPGKIAAIRSLEAAGPSGMGKSRQQIFYQQAMLMKDYEDSYRFPGTVHHYYPTYSSLDDGELRGYFGWRTRMRHGDLAAESLSYAYLYIYELLDQIGVADPEDGYDKLSSFFADYAQLDARIERYKSQWLQDYVVYYDLDQELLPPDWDVRWDKDIGILSSVQEHGGNGDAGAGRSIDIFQAMADVSQYDITVSNFYKGLPAEEELGERKCYREAMETVAPRVFARISGHYSRRRKVTLIEDYFGHSGTVRYVPFAEAMFYSGSDMREFDYRLSPLRAFHCRQGRWSVTGYAHPPGRNRKMDTLMRAVDFEVRDFYKYPQGSTEAAKEKWISRIILEECGRYDAEYKRQQELNITFEYSRLAWIRKDAASTRDKLIVDEDTDGVSAAADDSTGSNASDSDYATGLGGRDRVSASVAVIDTQAEADASSVLLDPDEKRLVSCLLEGGDLSWVPDRGLMLSVLADSINEKLYDEFADMVIDGGEEPSIINDYREDVRKLLFP